MLEKLEKGWCKGVIGDHVGIFPESYVEFAAEQDLQRSANAVAIARALHDFTGMFVCFVCFVFSLRKLC
jgi:hypothetical protein